MVDSTLDFYGNKNEPQYPTPTTLLLASRKPIAEIECKETKYTAKLPLWEVSELERILEIKLIEKQIQIFLKDQPKEKRFTLELTIKEVK
jgi:ribosome-binding protein aMBF1 (putative translation factor)